ncbi:hypothetical protein AB0J85_19410 [Micromonospora echinofusca]|uniref:hypothetical protein n=1 Tax=Micromonospora echinofusca TaxID=47858 RepID=UPI003440F285
MTQQPNQPSDVKQDDSVPGPDSSAQGSVGIGMSGAGTFVVSTQPNAGVEFEITPTYRLAFGSYTAGAAAGSRGDRETGGRVLG